MKKKYSADSGSYELLWDILDEVIKEHLHPQYPTLWEETSRWDDVYSHDRLWS